MKNKLTLSILLFLIFISISCNRTDDDNPILSDENLISSFIIETPYYSTKATIDNVNGLITKRLPTNIDLKNLSISLSSPNKSKTNLSKEEMKDFSSNKTLIITSESGISKEYTVIINHMDKIFEKSCNEMNASKWFGGDNRKSDLPEWQPYDRNVGTGQTIILEEDLQPLVFNIRLSGGFRYDEDNSKYDNSVNLKLLIRDESEELITEITTEVKENFNGGYISFDLEKANLFLEKNKTYIFQWYLINGEILGINTGSYGNTDELSKGFCFNGGYSGESRIRKSTKIYNADTWYKHSWNFNIELKGKE